MNTRQMHDGRIRFDGRSDDEWIVSDHWLDADNLQ